MNKTIIININGTVFHIEEDAYEILKTYMTDVTRHFMNSADSLEITTDIENRIAEMFTETLIRESKQVIVAQDVKAVVEQMGSVEDFESAEEDGEKPTGHGAYGYTTENRRLFRDADDHLVAGVCAGIANYFDIKSAWIRLMFVILCPFAGMGLLLYAILWIVVPKAVTRADRMAMKGQKLDLQGFKNNFEAELSTVRGNINDLRHEAKPFIYKTRDFAGDIFGHFGSFFRESGKLLVKLIGIAILLACFAGVIGLIVAIITYVAYGNMGLYHIFPFNIVNQQINNIFIVCAFLMIAIPLLAIILVTIGLVFNGKTINRTTGSTLVMVWIVALSVVIYYSVKISADFRDESGFKQTINIKPSADSTYYLKLNDVKFLTGADSIRLNISEKFNDRIILDNDEDNNMDMPDKNIDIDIEKSDVSQPVLVESFSARGRNEDDALFNARNISYQFIQQGNVLKFNRRLEKLPGKLWRAQRLRLILRIPLNSKLVIDRQLDRFIHDISVYDCSRDNKQEDAKDAKFIMTDNGLQCKVDTLVLPKTDKALSTAPADSATAQ